MCKISAISTGSSIRYTALLVLKSQVCAHAIYHDYKPLYYALLVDFDYQISRGEYFCTRIHTGEKQVKLMPSSRLGKPMKLKFAGWSLSPIGEAVSHRSLNP